MATLSAIISRAKEVATILFAGALLAGVAYVLFGIMVAMFDYAMGSGGADEGLAQFFALGISAVIAFGFAMAIYGLGWLTFSLIVKPRR